MNKKFIKTLDEQTAKRLIAEGFKLISQANGLYTFLNQPPKGFVFDDSSRKKIIYDNMLSL